MSDYAIDCGAIHYSIYPVVDIVYFVRLWFIFQNSGIDISP